MYYFFEFTNDVSGHFLGSLSRYAVIKFSAGYASDIGDIALVTIRFHIDHKRHLTS